MATANLSLRRRAAWAVLAPLMDEDALIEALWMQHDGMRGESVSDIIGFIDAVATRNLLDAATRKRLYAAYFEALRQADDTLPIDPWPLMLLVRPSAAPVSATPMPTALAAQRSPASAAGPITPVMPAVPVAPVAAAPGPSTPSPGFAASPPAPPSPSATPEPVPAPANPHQAVFAALASSLVGGVRQFHAAELPELLSDCRARFERLRLPAALRQRARDALSSTELAAWYLDAAPEQLASVVHELYVGLCEALGPVAADQVLVQAVRQAEQRPEARQVPPSRFL